MDQSASLVLIIALFIIMFGMGLTLTARDFSRILKYPKAVIGGLVNQIILLPIVGFTIASFFSLKAELAVGLIILAACPGGATSNLIAHLAKGDTALSVTLTAFSSLITILTIPLFTALALQTYMGVNDHVDLNIPQIFAQLLVIIVIPISLGMLVRSRKPTFADKMERPVKIASTLVLALVITGIALKEKDNIVDYFEQAGSASLALNLVTMLLGVFTARLLRLNRPQTVTVVVESGIQNGTMAIGVATIALSNSAMAIPAAIYSLIMFATGFAIILISTSKSSAVIGSS